ncbi:MAG: flagella synthesis protein FlgN [Oceanicoccus sp.]|jgi:flagella synthesis protein FlgN
MTNNNSTLWAELRTVFNKDIPVTTQLLTLLQDERTALETRNYDEFQDIIGKKQTLLETLESHARIRQQLLQNAGFNDEGTTLEAADQQAPIVAKAWRLLGEQWSKCQELNEINEQITSRTRLVVSQTLDLLRGQNTKEKLYDGKGNTNNSSLGRSITSA